ncbi:MAG: ABC transporter substrate-binding protein [Alphaproteobacteria bacterium]|nr:ABC transporter substrate-binding protein [Alphaproteobacteria bacterium]
MRRREFIEVMVGATSATVWQLCAQAGDALPVIGVLGTSGATDYNPMIAAFRKGLSEAGYVEGKSVSFDYVWADNQYNRLPELASELVRHRVRLILAAATPAALALRSINTTVPVVFAIGGDPVKTGLVSTLNMPGGNITGAAHINVETAPKRLELLHELLPTKQNFGLLTNPRSPLTASVETTVKAAADSLGLKLTIHHASTDEEIDALFKQVADGGEDGLVIGTDPFFTSRVAELGAKSLRLKVPAIYQYRDFAAAGGTMSYGGDIKQSYYLPGIYAGRILQGAKPSDLPVQLSTRVEFFINLRNTKALGIDTPNALVGRADEVIE